MNRTDAPEKKAVPFAVNGQREALLATTPAGDNSASYESGFPPVTMILKAAGGIPPKGQDFNQILYELALGSRWGNAGGGYGYDSDFATAIGGYPAGSMILSTDGAGYWLNTSESNSANPEVTNGSLTGWVPVKFYGSTSITGLTNSNVTLTSLQAARDRIELAGTLTGNINIVVPAWRKSWVIVNGTTGAFTVTVKTPSGTGISISSGKKATVYGDSVNITDVGYLQATNNLSEILAQGSTAQALTRTNIGLGTAAVANVGTGADQIPDMNSFPGGTGWCKLPGGKILQWGTFSNPTTSTGTITFPIPFVNYAGFPVIGLRGSSTTTSAAYIIHDDAGSEAGASKTSFNYRYVGSQTRFNWVCLGE